LSSLLRASFFNQPVEEVARNLLGKRLVRYLNGDRISGYINETEAYCGEDDLASHAHVGRTPRNEVMFGPPGMAYVYFIYGIHWCLNCVTGPEGFPAAVLLRGLLPCEGLDKIASNRKGRPIKDWCNGPAKLCSALAIDGIFNRRPLFEASSNLWIEEGIPVAAQRVSASARVGIDKTPEPWRNIPWRFSVHLSENEKH
jgi:DNA-3-methyladenine glycosylase